MLGKLGSGAPAKVKWETSAGAVTVPNAKSESMNKTRLRDLDRGLRRTSSALTIAAGGLLAGGCDNNGKNRVTKEGAEGVATSGLGSGRQRPRRTTR